MFKYPKMRNVTQILLNEISYQTFFFFLEFFTKHAPIVWIEAYGFLGLSKFQF